MTDKICLYPKFYKIVIDMYTPTKFNNDILMLFLNIKILVELKNFNLYDTKKNNHTQTFVLRFKRTPDKRKNAFHISTSISTFIRNWRMRLTDNIFPKICIPFDLISIFFF